MFKVNNKETRTTPLASFWCLYCLLRAYFIPYSSVPCRLWAGKCRLGITIFISYESPKFWFLKKFLHFLMISSKLYYCVISRVVFYETYRMCCERACPFRNKLLILIIPKESGLWFQIFLLLSFLSLWLNRWAYRSSHSLLVFLLLTLSR